jgi:Cu+-exporting ATPase
LAFGYYLAAIPLAAAGILPPIVAGATMALSSVSVVSNSVRLFCFGGTRTSDLPASTTAEPPASSADHAERRDEVVAI